MMMSNKFEGRVRVTWVVKCKGQIWIKLCCSIVELVQVDNMGVIL